MAEVLDLVVCAGVLLHELVAGKAEELELVGVRFLEGLVEGFEGGELRGEAAFGGSVDDEDYAAAEGGEGEGLAFFWGEGVSGVEVEGWRLRGGGREGRGVLLSLGEKS